MKIKLFLSLVFTLTFSCSFAQIKETKGKYYKQLPGDLNKETLIFLKHDSVDLPNQRPKEMKKDVFARLKNHNKVIPTSNKQLRDGIKSYPFKYIVASVDQLDSLSKANYKYVLYHPGLEKVKTGTRLGTSSSGQPGNRTVNITLDKLVIMDLQNNDIYLVHEFSETFVYYYKGLIKELMKKLNKQYNLKS